MSASEAPYHDAIASLNAIRSSYSDCASMRRANQSSLEAALSYRDANNTRFRLPGDMKSAIVDEWSVSEIDLFQQALSAHGANAHKIAAVMNTRDVSQVQAKLDSLITQYVRPHGNFTTMFHTSPSPGGVAEEPSSTHTTDEISFSTQRDCASAASFALLESSLSLVSSLCVSNLLLSASADHTSSEVRGKFNEEMRHIALSVGPPLDPRGFTVVEKPRRKTRKRSASTSSEKVPKKLTSYALFVKDKFSEARVQDEDLSTTSKRVSGMWKEISEQEKDKYKQRANEYNLQHNLVTPKKKKTSSEKSKRRVSGYSMFLKSKMGEALEEGDGGGTAQAFKQIGKWWGSLDDDEKKRYQREADEFNELHHHTPVKKTPSNARESPAAKKTSGRAKKSKSVFSKDEMKSRIAVRKAKDAEKIMDMHGEPSCIIVDVGYFQSPWRYLSLEHMGGNHKVPKMSMYANSILAMMEGLKVFENEPCDPSKFSAKSSSGLRRKSSKKRGAFLGYQYGDKVISELQARQDILLPTYAAALESGKMKSALKKLKKELKRGNILVLVDGSNVNRIDNVKKPVSSAMLLREFLLNGGKIPSLPSIEESSTEKQSAKAKGSAGSGRKTEEDESMEEDESEEEEEGLDEYEDESEEEEEGLDEYEDVTDEYDDGSDDYVDDGSEDGNDDEEDETDDDETDSEE